MFLRRLLLCKDYGLLLDRMVKPGLRKGRYRMKKRIKILILLMTMLLITGCEKKDKTKELLVGAAASLKPVMEEITAAYQEENPGITVNYNFAGSGTLEQQIRQGADLDLFLSASKKQMNSLEEDHYLLENSKTELLLNQLVLVVPKDSKSDISGFKDIIKAAVIALGDPASVPAGQYAAEVLDFYDVTDEVTPKAVYGKDVTEVLTWVGSGNADTGIVYSTDAISSDKVKVLATAPEESHSPIVYLAAVLRRTEEEEIANQYLDFLRTKKSKEIFMEYGFQMSE